MLACIAWRFWFGALSNKRGRAEKPRGDWGGSKFSRGFAANNNNNNFINLLKKAFQLNLQCQISKT